MQSLYQSSLGVLLAVISMLARAAEDRSGSMAPEPTVDVVWVFVFLGLFVGICVWMGVAIWRGERGKSGKESQERP